jgi:hypothetical protein
MTTTDDLQLQTADGRALGLKDLMFALMRLIEADADARAFLAEVIGPAAPRGEAGVAWVPDLAITSEGYLRVARWFARPADAGPPPTGILSENGIIADQPDAHHRTGQIVAGLVEAIMRETGGDEAEAGRYLEQNHDEVVKAINAAI